MKIAYYMKAFLSDIFYKLYCHMPYWLCTYIFSKIDYFHYKLLSFYEHPFKTKSKLPGVMGNECYGNLWAIKNATKDKFHEHCMIEHGIQFSGALIENECNMPCIDTIYTFSEFRKKVILDHFGDSFRKEIFPIGPYILYVDNFKSSRKLKKLKGKLGKVLLVLPSHSTLGYKMEYDETAFLHEVDKISKDYDTVLVSLFWADIRYGRDKMYLKKGYKVVCSGTRSDRWFLSRQKDLFELADFSMSNEVGTHVGYLIALGCPHYIFKQKMIELHEYSNEETDYYSNDKDFNLIRDAFSSKKPVITEEQKKIVDHYWGLSSVITENCRYRNSL